MMREDYLGTDVLFDEDGDLAVGPTGNLVSVSGRDCLLQDIRDRLGTLPGDLFAHPDWGCGIGRLLGALDTPLNRALAIRYIRHALEADPRVEDNTITITPLIFTPEEKRFEIHFKQVGSLAQEPLIWNL
ncbi:GPW/gp25 family protein [bacterium]|nr:GPW/gp25 family protein [bacterium]